VYNKASCNAFEGQRKSRIVYFIRRGDKPLKKECIAFLISQCVLIFKVAFLCWLLFSPESLLAFPVWKGKYNIKMYITLFTCYFDGDKILTWVGGIYEKLEILVMEHILIYYVFEDKFEKSQFHLIYYFLTHTISSYYQRPHILNPQFFQRFDHA